jgi:hypothetical protein
MGLMLSKSELAQTEPAERAAFRSPVPTQIVSNGEFNPLPQTATKRPSYDATSAGAESGHRLAERGR